MKKCLFAGMLGLVFSMIGVGAFAASIVVQSTTSTKNSGFYDYLLPIFTKETGIQVHVVAVGTGAAVRNAMNCDGDVLLVHSSAREKAFVREGYAPRRYDLMYNDFVLIGPSADPAGVGGKKRYLSCIERNCP